MHENCTSQRTVPSSAVDPSPAEPAAAESMIGAVRRALSSRLLLMTTMAALDGQVLALAASGELAHPVVIATVAFTMIAGVGAFATALQEVRLDQPGGRRVFLATAAVSTVANTLAASLGVLLAQAYTLEWLPLFAAAALVAIALEIGGRVRLRLPPGVPVPVLLVGVGLVVEVIL